MLVNHHMGTSYLGKLCECGKVMWRYFLFCRGFDKHGSPPAASSSVTLNEPGTPEPISSGIWTMPVLLMGNMSGERKKILCCGTQCHRDPGGLHTLAHTLTHVHADKQTENLLARIQTHTHIHTMTSTDACLHTHTHNP